MEIKTYKIKDICDITRGRVISKLDIKKDPGVFPVYSAATNNDGE
ncbi:restriction endonuclease subunit S, partial [Mycoplasmoides pneumoniae]